VIFLLAYSHVHYAISFSMVIHTHIKLMNVFGNHQPPPPQSTRCASIVRTKMYSAGAWKECW